MMPPYGFHKTPKKAAVKDVTNRAESVKNAALDQAKDRLGTPGSGGSQL